MVGVATLKVAIAKQIADGGTCLYSPFRLLSSRAPRALALDNRCLRVFKTSKAVPDGI